MKPAPYTPEQIERAVVVMRDYAADIGLPKVQREANIRFWAMDAIAMILANAEHYVFEMD
jgi:hypothetical protein